jgi:HK97 family phage prohead protease
MGVVAVEASAKIVRGLAVPFNRPALVADLRDDAKGYEISREVFDDLSLLMPADLPLLIHHDETRPVGRITRTWSSDAGLEVEGELIGGAAALDDLREKIGAGLQSSLSIGFVSDPRRDVWTAGKTKGEPPTVRRRGARLREVSLCIRGSYGEARVYRISNRTERQVAWRREQDAIEAEQRRQKAQRRARTAVALADAEAFVTESQQRHAAVKQPPAPPPAPPDDDVFDRLSLPPYNLPPCPDKPDLLDQDAVDRYNIELDAWLAEARRVSAIREREKAAERAAEDVLFARARRAGPQLW